MKGGKRMSREKAKLILMAQAKTPERIKALVEKGKTGGAEAFGMQFEKLSPKYRNSEIYKDLFSYAGEKATYVTNYRHAENEGKTDIQLAAELVELARCGAAICGVMARPRAFSRG